MPQGQFQFNRLPFGLSSGPQAFQRVMLSLFGKVKSVHIYIDDLLLATDNIGDHCFSLQEIVRIVRENKFRLNWGKCLFNQSEISFLGQIIANNIVRADLTSFNESWLKNTCYL